MLTRLVGVLRAIRDAWRAGGTTSQQSVEGRSEQLGRQGILWLIVVGLVGLLGLALYASQYSLNHASVVGVGIVVAGAALLIGGLLGFLFGIPHTVQGEYHPEQAGGGSQVTEPAKAQPGADRDGEPSYRANTNLEQISDWLTKILVGVGLTQLTSIPAKMDLLGKHLALGPGEQSATFAMGLCVYFVLCGFLIGFLWTRLYLQRAMRESDIVAVGVAVAKAEKAFAYCQVAAQDAQDYAKAWALVSQQLSLGPGVPAVNEKDLNERIKETTGANRARIFYEAARVRSNNWSANKPLMERTIPIFKALIATDPEENRHPEYHGELGFALKDKEPPDYKGALEQLETTIRMRRELHVSEGQAWYEFLRAVCRIHLDQNFGQKQPSDSKTKGLILEDLKAARDSGLIDPIRREDAACGWIKLNGLDKEFGVSA